MRHIQSTFINAQGFNICTQQWLPAASPRAGLLLVHGIAEHCGRYQNLVDRLVPAGFAIFGLDHPGHGLSDGPRTYVHSFSDFVTTVHQYDRSIRAANPGLPLFVYGHSLGGLITLHLLPGSQSGFRGAILSAPPVTIPDHVSGSTLMMARIFSRLLPRIRLVALDSSGLSRDPKVVDEYNADPLVFTGKVTARLGAELTDAISGAEAAAGQVSLPVLILQGTADPIVDPEGAGQLLQWLRSSDKTLQQYPELFHEVHNEPEKEQVLDNIQSWLLEHL